MTWSTLITEVAGPLKLQYVSTRLQGDTYQKTVVLIVSAVRVSHITELLGFIKGKECLV
jgi:hypothetical protein